MKKCTPSLIVTLAMLLGFIACLIWAAVAPRMQALIPTILAIILAVGLVDYRTDNIHTY